MRLRVYLFLAVTLALAGGGWWFNQKYTLDGWAPKARAAAKAGEKKAEEKAPEAVPVEVQPAISGAIASRIRSTANLRALRDVVLQSQVQGVVREVLVEEGAAVETGQLLCRLDDRELQISLELARQRLAQNRVQLESAKILLDKNRTQIANKRTELGRNEKALEQGLVSDTDVALLRNQLAELGHDERAQEASVRQTQHQVGELETEIRRVESQIDQMRIAAPFAGRITERTVELGQTVSANTNLFRLATFSPLFADVFLSEQDSRRVRPGQPVAVMLGMDDEAAEARVVRISPVVDNATGTVKVTAELRPPGAAFRPGAFVRVAIETDTRSETVLIPKRAVVEEGGQSYVFVNDGEIAVRRPVQLGYEEGDAVEARSGVAAGEQIVVAGQGKLKDGDKTRVVGS